MYFFKFYIQIDYNVYLKVEGVGISNPEGVIRDSYTLTEETISVLPRRRTMYKLVLQYRTEHVGVFWFINL